MGRPLLVDLALQSLVKRIVPWITQKCNDFQRQKGSLDHARNASGGGRQPSLFLCWKVSERLKDQLLERGMVSLFVELRNSSASESAIQIVEAPTASTSCVDKMFMRMKHSEMIARMAKDRLAFLNAYDSRNGPRSPGRCGGCLAEGSDITYTCTQ